jgi:DnaJ-class molecular chaperone
MSKKTETVGCPACNGTGILHLPPPVRCAIICNRCRGMGKYIVPKPVGVPSQDKQLDN